MKHDQPNITVYCAGCSKKISVPEHVANGPNPVFCSDACQMDQEHLEYLASIRPEPDYGGVLGANNQVYSDADPGL